MASYVEQLRNIMTGDVHDDDETLDEYSTDASIFSVRPAAVVFPKDVADLKKLTSFVSEHKDEYPDISLTARSAGTDMSGGPLNDSIIVGFNRYFDHEEINEAALEAIVEPGVYYHDFENLTLPKHISMPVYPASKSIAALGGMIMNNCGGEKTLRYGQMRNFVTEVNMVLADGNEYSFGPLDKEALDEKMRQDDFEGEVYRNMFELLDTNYDLVKNAQPATRKNSAGYALWEVWDREEGTFDLSQLFVGSQGTLGILTRAKARLIKQVPHRRLATIFMEDWDDLPAVVNELLALEPEAIETFDDETLKLGLRFMPEIAKAAGENLFSFALEFFPEFKVGLKMMGLPKLTMLVEFAEEDEQKLAEKLEALPKKLSGFDDLYLRITEKDEEEKYWTMRRKSFALLREHVEGKRTAPFIDDFAVVPEKLPEVLPQILDILKEEDIHVTLAGHAGSGNFHIIPLMDLSQEEEKEKIPRVAKKVYEIVVAAGGTITAEHNDGLIRSPFLEKMYGGEVYELFKEVKKIFDPDNIFNPGKKVDSDFKWAMRHISHE